MSSLICEVLPNNQEAGCRSYITAYTMVHLHLFCIKLGANLSGLIYIRLVHTSPSGWVQFENLDTMEKNIKIDKNTFMTKHHLHYNQMCLRSST